MGHLTDIPILILAAGGSTRMGGRDKLMEQVDGRPLVRRQADLARSVTSGDVLVALPPPPHPRYDALTGAGVVELPVAEAAEGMNASLRTAFANVPKNASAALLMLADLPDLTRDDLTAVLSSMDDDNLVWRGATDDEKPGHPILFSNRLFPAFAALSGDSGGQDVIHAAGKRVVIVPLPGTHALRDLDTPQDWAAWRADNPTRSK
jgi:CTP:molybdopterin cytidylyltransferase MocA